MPFAINTELLFILLVFIAWNKFEGKLERIDHDWNNKKAEKHCHDYVRRSAGGRKVN